MSKEEKTTVTITNRPSQKNRHTSREWVDHIGLRESEDAKRDIIDARDRLGQFSIRFVTEAIYGDNVAQQLFGDDGGQELVRDMKIDHRTLKTLAGNVGGKRSAVVVERSVLREVEVEEPKNAVSDQQVELLKALLKTMDPNVVKRALNDD